MASSKPSYRLTITLRDGASHSFVVAKMPRHYGSWLMQQLPYGTNFQGCVCSREVVS
jgi:hypothetical protein